MREGTGVRPVWVVVSAVVAALLAAPVGAVAATQLVKITGSTGKVAAVDPANRLQVAESSPKALVDTGFLQLDQSQGCTTLFHVPGTKALIVTQVNVLTSSSPSFDSAHVMVLAKLPSCAGGFWFIDQPHQAGSELFTLEPGVTVPAGSTISGQSIGSGTIREIEIRGYFVPKTAVS